MIPEKRLKRAGITFVVYYLSGDACRSRWQGIDRLFVRVLPRARARSKRLACKEKNGARLVDVCPHPGDRERPRCRSARALA